VRALVFRFEAFSRPVRNTKKYVSPLDCGNAPLTSAVDLKKVYSPIYAT
jgi:hypothetical protein